MKTESRTAIEYLKAIVRDSKKRRDEANNELHDLRAAFKVGIPPMNHSELNLVVTTALIALCLLAGCSDPYTRPPCINYDNLSYSRCEHAEGSPLCIETTRAYLQCLQRNEAQKSKSNKE